MLYNKLISFLELKWINGITSRSLGELLGVESGGYSSWVIGFVGWDREGRRVLARPGFSLSNLD